LIALELVVAVTTAFVKPNKYKTIGILGGMGPEATLDLYRAILDKTRASSDQDHIPVVIFSFPQIPDRTKALLDAGPDPTPYLLYGIDILKRTEVDFVIIPCNTAHKFLFSLLTAVEVPIIDMIEETVNYIARNYPESKNLGLMATTGTIKTNLYDNYCDGRFELIIPDDDVQEIFMRIVYGNKGLKAGCKSHSNRKLLISVIKHLKDKGADIIVMGCTEVPLILRSRDSDLPLINPTEIVAMKAVELAGN
jgi:aspartate racemase